MTGWSFDPVGGWWLVMAAALALAPLLAIGPAQRKQSVRRRVSLVALRMLTLVLLLLAMLRPALETRTTRKLPGTLVVLPDLSRSMTVGDAGGGKSRYAAMKSALDDSAAEFAGLAQDWDVHAYGFGRDSEPVKFAEGKFELPAEPTGEQTAIGSAIEDVLARESQRIVAVLLLSDGAQRAFAPRDIPPQTAVRQLAADGIPLYTLAFGQPSLGQENDLRMSDMMASDAVFAETPTTVEGVVTAAGYANKEVKVQLLWENADGEQEAVDTQTIRIQPRKQRYPVRLNYTPKTPGEYKVTLQVESPEGELITSNNSQSTFVNVLKGGVKVLYLAGASRIGGLPGIEPGRVVRALAANPDMHVDYQVIDYNPAELDLRDRLRDEKYDVILLGDVDATGLNARSWGEMAKLVERGAGLAMLGGFHSFGPGGFANTTLQNVLPVEMSRTERQNFGEPTRKDVHVPGPIKMLPVPVGGEVHPIMRMKDGNAAANEELWQELPPLDGANKLPRVQVKDLARVIAEGNDGSRSPLLIVTPYGDGRSAALGVDSTWHWKMEGFGDVHRRFWRQLVLWLAKKDETAGEQVWVRLDQRRFQQGSRVDFTLGAENAEGGALDNAEYAVQVEKPDGTSETVRVARRGNVAVGSFNATEKPGDYRIAVTARDAGQSVGTATARFSISDQDVELDQPAAEPMLLASLARVTAEAGGAGLAPEELPDLLERLKERADEFEEEIVETVTLWDSWPVLLTFAGLLSTEWFLRKRWGMV